MNGISEKLLIHAGQVSNRLRYTAGIVVERLMGLEVGFTASAEEFSTYPGPRIVYGEAPLPGELFIRACGLLTDGTRIPVSPPPVVPGRSSWLYPTPDPDSCLPFDPFAASFFMLSRCEEYHSRERDRHGRFPAEASVAFRNGFLDQPVVHAWAGMLSEVLTARFPGLLIKPPRYRYVPTIDIDHAWQFRGRGVFRTLGGVARSLAVGRLDEVARRLGTLAGTFRDPFDTYDYILRVHDASGIQPLWFVLFADRGGADNQVRLSGRHFRQLLTKLDSGERLAIHPSLAASRHPSILQMEYDGLCDLLGRPVIRSRQHFLALEFPRTCRELIRLGITHDYTLGYASHPGFRAGIAVPFPFYDLEEDRATELMLHPLSVMDVTMRDYLRLNAVESLDRIAAIIRKHREAGGEFVSLWHNESLSETGRWRGWRQVYEATVVMASEGISG